MTGLVQTSSEATRSCSSYLWLLVGTPSTIRPGLAFSRVEHSLPYSDVTIYIFTILYLSYMLYVYWFLLPLRLGWLLVCCLYKEVYLQFFKRVSFWLHGCCGEWEGWVNKPGKPYQLSGRSYSNWPSYVGPQPPCNRTFLLRCLCCHFALMTFLLVYGLLS